MLERINVYVLYLAGFKIAFPRIVTPLGPLIVASSIRHSPSFGAGDKVIVCDSFKEVAATFRKYRREHLYYLVSSVQVLRGVTVDTNTAIRSVKRVKALHPRVKTVVGGPDVSINPQVYADDFDLVFDGEVGNADLVEIIQSDQRYYLSRDVDINSETVDYEVLAGKKYLAGSIQTSRGCPFRCSFCNVISIYGKDTRVLSDEALYARLESLSRIHRGFVIISDDNVGSGIPQRAEQVLDVIIDFQEKNDYPFVFGIQASMNLTRKPTFMKKLSRAGVIGALIGVESPSRDVLIDINKRHNVTDALASQIRVFIDHGIFPLASFIFGLDREPDDVVEQFKLLLEKCGTPLVGLNLFNPVRGSRLRDEYREQKRLLSHPIYYEHDLIPARTVRDYSRVVDDYIEMVRWIYEGRRLTGYSSRLSEGLSEGRDQTLERVFAQQVTPWLTTRMVTLYIILCLRSRTWAGFGHLLQIARGSRTDRFVGLMIAGIAMAQKCEYLAIVRKLQAGMKRLRKERLYPYADEVHSAGGAEGILAGGSLR